PRRPRGSLQCRVLGASCYGTSDGCLFLMRKARLHWLSRFGKTLRPSLSLHLAVQPGAGVNPVTLGGSDGDAQRLGGVLKGQPCEVAQLDQACLERILSLQLP